MIHLRGQVDQNDIAYITRLHGRPLFGMPCPMKNGKVNPQTSRFLLANGKTADVFHVKPIYYEALDEKWYPLSDIADFGNRWARLKEGAMDKIHPCFLRWWMKRMELIGGNISVPMPHYPRYVKIREGREIYFTTSTFYPDASTGGTTVDGWVMNNTVTPTWATIRNAVGNLHDDTSADSGVVIWQADATNYNYNLRAIYTFDTSSIPDTDVVSSAVLSFFGTGKVDPFSNAPNINVYLATPASNNDLVNADYQQIGSVAQSTAKAYADWSIIAYNDFTLNDLTKIVKTGISKFGLRNVNYDVDNLAPAKSGAGGETGFNAKYADVAGTTQDPKLVVTYTLPTAVALNTMLLMGV